MSSEDQHSAKKLPQRLPSLRGLRDLTLKDAGLGNPATVPKKRTFTPVLPTQSKVKVQNEANVNMIKHTKGRFVSEFDPPPELKMKSAFMRGKPNHTESNRGAGRGRGRGQEPVDEGQFVQMKSVFAEGPMQRQDAFLKSGFSNSFGSSREGQTSTNGGGSGSGLRGSGSGRMKFDGNTSNKEEAMECKEDVASILEDLLRDDFIADGSSSVTNDTLEPVVLPLPNSKRTETKSILKFKPEAGDNIGAMDVDVVTKPSVEDEKSSEIFEISSARSDELMLIQLPDTLPGIPFEKALNTKENISNSDQKFLLSDFEESNIGQLVVRRSGKMQLVINNIAFDVVMGTKASFLQEVVSLQVPDGASSSDLGLLSVLGHVRHKLLCIPDFNQLLGEPQPTTR